MGLAVAPPPSVNYNICETFIFINSFLFRAYFTDSSPGPAGRHFQSSVESCDHRLKECMTFQKKRQNQE